jgi:hypothetical protein
VSSALIRSTTASARDVENSGRTAGEMSYSAGYRIDPLRGRETERELFNPVLQPSGTDVSRRGHPAIPRPCSRASQPLSMLRQRREYSYNPALAINSAIIFSAEKYSAAISCAARLLAL